MVQPANIPADTGGADEPQDVQKKDSSSRPVLAPLTDDGRKKKPFKEVLDTKLLDEEVKTSSAIVSSADDGDEKVSLLDLAAQALIRDTKSKPSITNTAVFFNDDGTELVDVDVDAKTPLVDVNVKANVDVIKDTPDTKSALVDVKLVKEDVPVAQVGTKVNLGDVKPVKAKVDVKLDADIVADADTVVVEAAPDAPKPVIGSTKPLLKVEVEALPKEVIGKGELSVAKKVDVNVVAEPKGVLKPVAEAVVLPKAIVKDLEKVSDSDTEPVTPVGLPKEETKEKKIEESVKSIAINPAAVPNVAVHVAAPVETKLIHDTNKIREVLIQLAQQMLEKIQQVTTPDRTDTTLTLKYPPLFAGVEVRITEFNSAQKQFNVTFAGLTDPIARNLVEMPKHQAALQQALIDKGYTLQMITIEQKIPGLSSSGTGDVALGRQGQPGGGDAETATDDDEGSVG